MRLWLLCCDHLNFLRRILPELEFVLFGDLIKEVRRYFSPKPCFCNTSFKLWELLGPCTSFLPETNIRHFPHTCALLLHQDAVMICFSPYGRLLIYHIFVKGIYWKYSRIFLTCSLLQLWSVTAQSCFCLRLSRYFREFWSAMWSPKLDGAQCLAVTFTVPPLLLSLSKCLFNSYHLGLTLGGYKMVFEYTPPGLLRAQLKPSSSFPPSNIC